MDIVICYVVCTMVEAEGYIAKEVAIYILVISKCMGCNMGMSTLLIP